jgi:hypothetical protein
VDRKQKRRSRVQKGREVKKMKQKFHDATRKKLKRKRSIESLHLKSVDRAVPLDDWRPPEIPWDSSRIQDLPLKAGANTRPSRAQVSPRRNSSASRGAAWTASEEASDLEILDGDGNRIPVHPENSLKWMAGEPDADRSDGEMSR